MRVTIFCSTVLALCLCTSCSNPAAEEPPVAGTEPEAEADNGGSMPEPTSEAVWNYLEENDYKAWAHWPGKEDFYPGTQPHGALLQTYLNEPAANAVEAKAGSMPPAAIIVKENYSEDRDLLATTVMYKSEGFDSEHNNWFWLKRLADGTVDASGKVESCQICHGMSAENDYIRTGPIR